MTQFPERPRHTARHGLAVRSCFPILSSLDRMIRKNELLWGDFCRPKYHWNEVTEEYEKYLDLNTHGYGLTDPNTTVPKTSKTVIPEPEKHFSFSTILMAMAIELFSKNLKEGFAILPLMLIKSWSILWNLENR